MKTKSIILGILTVAMLLGTACSPAAEDNAAEAVKPAELTALTGSEARTIGGCNTADGFYEMVAVENGKLIQYTDYATATSAPLCNRPECKHNDETCTAFLSNETALYAGIFIWNNKLIVACANPQNQAPTVLWLYNADGSGAEKIYTFADGDTTFDPVICDSKALYFLNERVETQGEECTYKRTVVRLEPETQTLKPLFTLAENETLVGAGGGRFIARRMTRDEKYELFAITPEGEKTELTSWNYFEKASYCCGDCVYLTDQQLTTLQRFDYNTDTWQETPIAIEGEAADGMVVPENVHGNILTVTVLPDDRNVYTLGINTQSGRATRVKLLGLNPYGERTRPMYIVAQAGDKYLVETGDLQDDNASCRALISVEDYWAGSENYEYITLINSK